MTDRPINFFAGPAILPAPVLEEASRGVLALDGIGLSILEISHRSKTFDDLIREAQATLKRVLDVPDTHEVLFLQGGARGQFAMVPTNFLHPGKRAGYVVTGVWGEGAVAEGARIGDAFELASSKAVGYGALPDLSGVAVDSDLAYVHTTSNNTIYGTQWQTLPSFGDVPHVSDMSSDIMSRPIDVGSFGLIYAGAQKNAGPAGVTLVIVDKRWIDTARQDVPIIWSYGIHAQKRSMYNTPPAFAIYVVGLVARWVEEQGGVKALAARNETKASLLCSAMESSDGFYTPTVAEPDHRSRMNVTWRLPSAELDAGFVAAAADEGLIGLKGHRKVGGIRASIYNASDLAGVERLVDLMQRFAGSNR